MGGLGQLILAGMVGEQRADGLTGPKMIELWDLRGSIHKWQVRSSRSPRLANLLRLRSTRRRRRPLHVATSDAEFVSAESNYKSITYNFP